MLHARIPKSIAEEQIRGLRRLNLIENDYEIIRLDTDILIPLSEGDKEALKGYSLEDHEGVPKQSKNYPARHSGSFDLVGKIAVVKVRSIERARTIADTIINSNKSIESVYYGGKLSEGERIRNLLLLAGRENTITIHRENGLRFKVDLSGVYFSPRLATERKILADEVKKGEQILDLFAGVGPFSITIASGKECSIEAIDINPVAVDLMRYNLKMNKLVGKVNPICQDSANYLAQSHRTFDRIIMNLPMEADRFIPGAVDHLSKSGVINLYFISGIENLTAIMEGLRKIGLDLESKRIVHGYSKDKNLYSLALRNNR